MTSKNAAGNFGSPVKPCVCLNPKKKKLPNGVTYVEDVMLLKMVDELLAKVGPFYAQLTNNDDFTPSDLA